MHSSKLQLLAMAPGKKSFGIAVFNGSELAHFSLRTLRKAKTRKLMTAELTRIVRESIHAFDPEIIVVKSVSRYQKSSTVLQPAMAILKREADVRKIRLIEISLEQITGLFCKNSKPTKKNAFDYLSTLYPELQRFLNQPSRSQAQYYDRLFSAVAGGVAVGASLVSDPA